VGAAQEAVAMKFRISVVHVGDDGTERSCAMMVLSREHLALETMGLTLAESKDLVHNLQTYLIEQQAGACLEQHRSCTRVDGAIRAKAKAAARSTPFSVQSR
jgi:hypothetical protein